MPTIPLVILLSISTAWAQENYIAVMGAGGEPQNKETTIFDTEIKKLGKFFKKDKQWNLSVSLNGGHNKTEQIISQGLEKKGIKNAPFIESNFDAMIADYEDKIRRGVIGPGDQLVLYISTHGAANSGKEKSHQISFSGKEAQDLNTLSNASVVSLDKLQNLISLANQQGVKLGILDFSCHSGNALNLANDKTCVISASGPDHFGYATWGRSFADNMKRGRSLEDVFLKTVSKRAEPSFPMISTPVGKDIQDEMYQLVGHYLNYWNINPWYEKLTKKLEDEVESNKCEQVDQNFQRLTSMIKDLRHITNSSKDRKKYDNLMRSLNEYHAFLNGMKSDLKRMDLPELQREENVCFTKIESNGKEVESCKKWKLKNLLKSDFDSEIISMSQYREKSIKENKTWAISWADNYIAELERSKARKAELMASNPGYQEYLNYYKKFPNLRNRTWGLASKVAKSYREVYLEEYQNGKNDSRPNPCRDIVL